MNITQCLKCGGEVIAESIGWKCKKCKGFINLKGEFFEHIEKPFLPKQTNNGKPKFMEHIQLSVPKIADMGEFKIGMKINTLIHPVEELDDAINEEIIKMIKEKGINDLYLLNKRAIVSALEKQIPKKGSIKYLSSYTDDPPVLLCPNCQEHIPTEGCNFYKYCYKCGQKIDWSDTE